MTMVRLLKYTFWTSQPVESSVLSAQIFQEVDHLSVLPTEIIHHVASFLPTESIVTLALCSKTLWNIIGSSSIQDLKKGRSRQFVTLSKQQNLTEEQRAWQTFLLLLEKDCPDAMFCYYCQKLHDVEWTIRNIGKWGGPGDIPCDDLWMTSRIYGYKGFNYSRMYMAMKLHRMGRSTKNMLSLMSGTTTEYYRRYTRQRSLLAKIVDGQFCLRTQHWILLTQKDSLDLPDSWFDWQLCRHLQAYPPASFLGHRCPTLLGRQIQCKLKHHRNDGWLQTFIPPKSCLECSSVHECPNCWTEYQIDFKKLWGRKSAIVITEWQQFGQILTPYDEHFKGHFRPYPNGGGNKDPIPEFGNIRNRFEANEFQFDRHLSKQAKKALLKPQYEQGG